MHHKIKKAVFPVGGMGTRFLPATKALPKEMLPIINKPLIQYAFEEAVNAGIEEFIFITGRNKNIIINHFDCVYELEKLLNDNDKYSALALTRDWVPEPGKIAFIRQQHPLGLGHAVWCARHFIQNEPFAVLLADELFMSSRSKSLLAEMTEAYAKNPGNIIAVSNVAPEETHRYGIVETSDDNGLTMKITNMVEKPAPGNAPSNLSIIGRYILQPEIFGYIENTPKGKGEEIQLTDAMKSMLQEFPFYGYRFNGKRLDCGTPLGFLEANLEMSLADESLASGAEKIIKNIASRL